MTENIQHKMFLYKNIPREIFHGGILVTNKKNFDCVNFHARSFFRCYFYVCCLQLSKSICKDNVGGLSTSKANYFHSRIVEFVIRSFSKTPGTFTKGNILELRICTASIIAITFEQILGFQLQFRRLRIVLKSICLKGGNVCLVLTHELY